MQTPKKKSKHFLSSEISTILNYPHKTICYLSSIPLSTLRTPFSLKIHRNRIHSISYKKLLSLKRKSEDACALSSSFIIVADGVGGYKTYGIDPSIYSSTLCDQVSKRVNFIRNENELKDIVVNVIREMDSKPIVGGATFCSLYIDNENKKYSDYCDNWKKSMADALLEFLIFYGDIYPIIQRNLTPCYCNIQYNVKFDEIVEKLKMLGEII